MRTINSTHLVAVVVFILAMIFGYFFGTNIFR